MSPSSNANSRLLRRDLLASKASAETVANAQREPGGDYQIAVFFPHALSIQKVETIRVQVAPLQPLASGLTANRKKCDIIPLRLHVPGALVVPAEQGIEPTPMGPAQAVFYVTPLATGALPAAHLEVLYPTRSQAIAVPLRVRSTQFWLRALLLVMVPILLWLPTCWPEPAGGAVERGMLEWLPKDIAIARAVAHWGQACYSFLAHPPFALSFWSLLLVVTAVCLWRLSQRVRELAVHGEVFRLQSAAKTATPPPFLTPLTEHELAEIQQRK
ncbi:MAG TPA: hypothetical protein VKS79_09070 [Gemmataceae bacterium]|nr:hypothetical protein [Gemmataceae bacterium]